MGGSWERVFLVMLILKRVDCLGPAGVARLLMIKSGKVMQLCMSVNEVKYAV